MGRGRVREQGHTALGTAQEVLEALQACAGRGAARPVCSLAAASFRAATALGMTCAEAARLAPRESLQILLMRGPQAAPVRIPYPHPTSPSWCLCVCLLKIVGRCTVGHMSMLL